MIRYSFTEKRFTRMIDDPCIVIIRLLYWVVCFAGYNCGKIECQYFLITKKRGKNYSCYMTSSFHYIHFYTHMTADRISLVV